MGKKTKIGKQRKDVFYNLAKETGYRSRAAFKLIQLNRKFQFLEKTRICVDLCAAPGGWMQVAQQHMPVSSFIIGIDLDPIKPIRNCQSFRSDITTEECRQLLRKELKTWKADTFLNDGAPNVGKSWDYDAFMQNCLTLSALKLATEFLNKGGYFVTKIFRSKDYNALIWVLNKLFRKVHATKPKASRSESAEIFVVCEDYLAPDHIDQKFFQSNYLFKDILDVDEIKKAKKEFLKPVSSQKKIKAIGYDDNLGILSVKLKVSEFIKSKNHVELLSRAHEIVFDNEEYENDSLTTELIKDYCKDIKVLNRKEILDLLKWQKILKKKYVKDEENEIEENNEDNVEEIDEVETEESKVDKFLKKKKKKVLKEKKKLIERMNLKMVHKDDNLVEEENGLFSLKQLQNQNLYDNFEKDQDLIDEVSSIEFEEDEDEKNLSKNEKKVLKRMKECKLTYVDKEKRLNLDEFNTAALSSDEEERDEFGNILDETTKKRLNKVNALNNKIQDIKEKMSKKKKLHKNLNIEEDEESISQLEDDDDNISSNEDDDQNIFTNEGSDSEMSYESDNELILNSGNENKLSKAKMFFDQGLLKNTNFDDDVELDLFDPEQNNIKKIDKKKIIEEKKAFSSDDSSDDSENEEKNKKPIKLDANGLALGTLMKKSDKTKRDIINEGWNRYSRGNEDLPSWFQKDEAKHFRKPISVPENLVKDYQAKLGNINVRTCKKVAEAKARKKRKAAKIMEKLRKKTEAITENDQMVEKEKISNIKKLYRKVVKGQNQNKTKLVVARRGRNNNRRPKGVKGKYKMVDARLKKDKRAQQKQTKLGKKKKVNKRLQKKPKLSKEEF